MSDLDRHVAVMCPLAQAANRLGRLFRYDGTANDRPSKLTLALSIDVPRMHSPLTLRRSVVATIVPHHLPADMTPRYRIRWAPERPGPFPLFSGELIVEGRADYDTFALRLTGRYTPPLGVLGEGFDLAIGHRVAEATADDLLCRIKERVEVAFAADERRKRPVGGRRAAS